MKYHEYMKKYGIGFTHDGHADGEIGVKSLEGLLQILKEDEMECPDKVRGLIPVWILIDPESALDSVEEALWNNKYAGEDYEMPEDGKNFLIKCFEEYNVKYANHGNAYQTLNVEVPEEMKYELEECE